MYYTIQVLHLLAVDCLLDLYQDFDASAEQTNLQGLQYIKMCQSTINSILSNSSQDKWMVKLKHKWGLVQAMIMYYEHIAFKHKKVPPKYTRKMRDVSRSITNAHVPVLCFISFFISV